MVGIVRRTFGQPDESYPTADGSVTNIVQVDAAGLELGGVHQADGRGGLLPDGPPRVHPVRADSLRMDDGTELIGEAGDYLEIQPGHLAWVIGDEPCVTIDW